MKCTFVHLLISKLKLKHLKPQIRHRNCTNLGSCSDTTCFRNVSCSDSSDGQDGKRTLGREDTEVISHWSVSSCVYAAPMSSRMRHGSLGRCTWRARLLQSERVDTIWTSQLYIL